MLRICWERTALLGFTSYPYGKIGTLEVRVSSTVAPVGHECL